MIFRNSKVELANPNYHLSHRLIKKILNPKLETLNSN
jgi:hypothetical protein